MGLKVMVTDEGWKGTKDLFSRGEGWGYNFFGLDFLRKSFSSFFPERGRGGVISFSVLTWKSFSSAVNIYMYIQVFGNREMNEYIIPVGGGVGVFLYDRNS